MSKSMAQIIAERKKLMEIKAAAKSNPPAPVDPEEIKRKQEAAALKKALKEQEKNEIAALKVIIDQMQQQINGIVSNLHTTPMKQTISPQEYYESLLALYHLPLSISAAQIEKTAIPDADHKLFMQRFTRVRKELNIYFAGVK